LCEATQSPRIIIRVEAKGPKDGIRCPPNTQIQKKIERKPFNWEVLKGARGPAPSSSANSSHTKRRFKLGFRLYHSIRGTIKDEESDESAAIDANNSVSPRSSQSCLRSATRKKGRKKETQQEEEEEEEEERK
jgi:hypothetical protein